jgi:hypothetical protein
MPVWQHGHLLEQFLAKLVTANAPTARQQLLCSLCLLTLVAGFQAEGKVLASRCAVGWNAPLTEQPVCPLSGRFEVEWAKWKWLDIRQKLWTCQSVLAQASARVARKSSASRASRKTASE